MESRKNLDGSIKTLFDYSPQNQNYIIINDILRWEQKNNNVPLLDRKQAKKVYNLIGRHFGSWQHCTVNRISYKRKQPFLKRYPLDRVRKCWIGKDYRKNYERLLHDISHHIEFYRTGSDDHSSSQSKLEKEILEWVIENDWFKEKIKHPEPKPKPVKIKLTKIEINEAKISKLEAKIDQQEKQVKRLMESIWSNKKTKKRLINIVHKQKLQQ